MAERQGWYAKGFVLDDIVRTARNSADLTGNTEFVHLHGPDEPCPGFQPPGCLAIRPDPRRRRALGYDD